MKLWTMLLLMMILRKELQIKGSWSSCVTPKNEWAEVLDIFSKEKLEGVSNLSLNETLSRTIITSLTTLIVVVVLLLMGGEVIHNFAFALTVGIFVGTYSSIFVASQVIVYLENRHNQKLAEN